MVYQDFRTAFIDQVCFTNNQVQAWFPGFDKNNLGRWVQKGYLIKLRNGYYSFNEYIGTPNIQLFFGNRMYRPSYISLHTALAFHGLIPESISQITSISTLKTAKFYNTIGTFSYKNVKPQLFFAYEQLAFPGEKTIMMANPEKAIIDLLYIYPFYNNEHELSELRLDEDYLEENFNTDRFLTYLGEIKNLALEKRGHLLLKTYRLK
jgi:predicted transcriptional regulator of viral defense system